IRKLIQDKSSDWASFVSTAVFAYNILIHTSTGYAPFKLVYGRSAALPPILYSLVNTSANLSTSNYLEKLIELLIDLQ
ncbi:hypothetical protein, partial [Vibrio sp. Vb2424]|uniref:hypothetical protein n=1 Tax=Vibrio sp. Vb2424 TaxID=2816074 RepID=UPI001A8E2421